MEAGSVSAPSLRRTFKIIESFESTTLTFNGAELLVFGAEKVSDLSLRRASKLIESRHPVR